jgi:predicted DCC family thiol-disulfide oxidoreductase YuxK
MPPSSIVYFDKSCPLCAAEISHYQKLEAIQPVVFVDVSQADCALGPGLTRDAAMARFHIRDETAQLQSGAAAFVHLWSLMPGWRHVARMARLPGALPVLERCYRGFLHVRPILARCVRRLSHQSKRPRP